MKLYLQIAQIIVTSLLILFILLQRRGGGFLFGGSGFYSTRRGLEKQIFIMTIILAIIFVALALLNLVMK